MSLQEDTWATLIINAVHRQDSILPLSFRLNKAKLDAAEILLNYLADLHIPQRTALEEATERWLTSNTFLGPPDDDPNRVQVWNGVRKWIMCRHLRPDTPERIVRMGFHRYSQEVEKDFLFFCRTNHHELMSACEASKDD